MGVIVSAAGRGLCGSEMVFEEEARLAIVLSSVYLGSCSLGFLRGSVCLIVGVVSRRCRR